MLHAVKRGHTRVRLAWPRDDRDLRVYLLLLSFECAVRCA